MSSILRALKKLEQDPSRGNPMVNPWQRKTKREKAFGRDTRSLRSRTVAGCILLVPVMVIGGWLLLKYATLQAEKSLPGKPVPPAAAIAKNMSTTVAPAPQKNNMKPTAVRSRSAETVTRSERVKAGETAVTSRPGGRVPEKEEKKMPAVNTRRVDTDPSQPAKAPVSAAGSSPQRGNENRTDSPSVRLSAPATAAEPAAVKRSVLAGISVQAIAWSKDPAERIAVINGRVVREGEFIGGAHVTQIGLEEVSLKKDDKIWLLQCGQ